MSGGVKAIRSPIARTISPAAWHRSCTGSPTLAAAGKGALLALSATGSTPAISPMPRTSPTSG